MHLSVLISGRERVRRRQALSINASDRVRMLVERDGTVLRECCGPQSGEGGRRACSLSVGCTPHTYVGQAAPAGLGCPRSPARLSMRLPDDVALTLHGRTPTSTSLQLRPTAQASKSYDSARTVAAAGLPALLLDALEAFHAADA